MRLSLLILAVLAGCGSHGTPAPPPEAHSWSDGAYMVTSDATHSFPLYIDGQTLTIGSHDLHAQWYRAGAALAWLYGGSVDTQYGPMWVYLEQPGHVLVIISNTRRQLIAVTVKGAG